MQVKALCLSSVCRKIVLPCVCYVDNIYIYIYKWHVCPGSYNKNPEEEQEEEVEEKK